MFGRFIVIGVLLAATACVQAPPPTEGMQRVPLLRITKSENDNYVVYDLLVRSDGTLPAEPIDAYWILAAEDSRRAELNSFEKDVYGVKVQSLEPEEPRLVFAIGAVDRRLEVEIAEPRDAATVSTTIDGEPAQVDAVHLLIRKKTFSFFPDVKVQLRGSASDGRTVEEIVAS